MTRSNVFSDIDDPTVDPVLEAADAVSAITSNDYEPVTITGVTFKSDIGSPTSSIAS